MREIGPSIEETSARIVIKFSGKFLWWQGLLEILRKSLEILIPAAKKTAAVCRKWVQVSEIFRQGSVAQGTEPCSKS